MLSVQFHTTCPKRLSSPLKQPSTKRARSAKDLNTLLCKLSPPTLPTLTADRLLDGPPSPPTLPTPTADCLLDGPPSSPPLQLPPPAYVSPAAVYHEPDNSNVNPSEDNGMSNSPEENFLLGLSWLDPNGEFVDEEIMKFLAEETTVPRILALEERIKERVSLNSCLASFLREIFGLAVCKKECCNFFCPKGKDVCRNCAQSAPNAGDVVSDDEEEESEGTILSDDEVARLMDLDEYEQLLEKPCKSPLKSRHPFARSKAVQNKMPACSTSSNVNSITKSSQRAFQLHLIPVVVYIMMRSLGYERESHASLRAELCNIVMNETLPRNNKFLFCKRTWTCKLQNDLGYDNHEVSKLVTIVKDASLITRATVFFLDLLATAEAYHKIDVVANIFLADESCFKMSDAELVHQYASFSYVAELASKMLCAEFKRSAVSVNKNSGEVQAIRGRIDVPDRTLRKYLLGPIMRSLLEGLPFVGFFPELIIGRSELSRAKEFADCIDADRDNIEPLVTTYLESMLGNLASASDVLEAVVGDGGVLRVLPFWLVAYACHLSRTAFRNNGSVFDAILVGRSGQSEVQLLSVDDGKPIAKPTFGNFSLKQSLECETDLTKMMLYCFKRRNVSDLFGLSSTQKRCYGEMIQPFSLNFMKEVENDTCQAEGLLMKFAANPSAYIGNQRFVRSMKSMKILMELVDTAAKDGDTKPSAENNMLLVAHSLLNDV